MKIAHLTAIVSSEYTMYAVGHNDSNLNNFISKFDFVEGAKRNE